MDKVAAELLRALRADFRLYALRCLKIRTKSGSIEPLVLNRAQEYIHARLEEQLSLTGKVRAIILKGRQQGASTYTEGRFYWKVSGQFGKQALILTHLQDASDNIFGQAMRYHEHCPDVVKPSTGAASAKEMHFDRLDSGYKVATAGSKAAGRSSTVQFFHGSEVGFWQNAEDHMAGIGQTVPDAPGTEIILESTANGIGNLFHSMWQQAERGESDYIAIFVPWFWQPEYRKPVPSDFVLDPQEERYMQLFDLDMEQIAWRRAKLVNDFGGDESLFNQEYPATPDMAFMAATRNSLINPLDVLEARKRKPDLEAIGAKVLGVDPAEYGDDDSAIVLRQGRKVLKTWRYSKVGPMELAGIVAEIIDNWQPDGVIVDVVGVGSGVADRLIELGYKIIRCHSGGKPVEDDRYMNKRAEMWGEMRDWIKDQPCEIPDDDALQSDLTGLTYSYDSSRRLVLESKEKLKKRGLKSPDMADALAFTFAFRVASGAQAAKRTINRTINRSSWRT